MKSGFVSLVGRPNVGKSSLVNALVGAKVAIISEKPQTTRRRIMGVRHFPGGQMVFLDTPGLHKPKTRLGEEMVRQAMGALSGVDVVGMVVDLSFPPGPGDREVARRVAQAEGEGLQKILILNKSDLLRGEGREERIAAYRSLLPPETPFFVVSAVTGEGLPELLAWLEEHLPEGPPYFPEGQWTDQPEELLLAEIIREQILHHLREEVPHASAVLVEAMEPRPGGLVYVPATIYVEKESQKGIVIGKGGQMLKAIGQAAREEAERILGTRLYLDLRVKVKEDWRDRVGTLVELGLWEREKP